jgi:hypothetical protein
MSLTFEVAPALDPPWTSLEPIVLGIRTGAVRAYLLVSADRRPALRLHLCDEAWDEYWFKVEVIDVGDLTIIGFAERLYVLNARGETVSCTRLASYFCGLNSLEVGALAASGEEIVRIGADGAVMWRSPRLGVDGVVIHDVEDGIVRGDGEWDPPGGWQPFLLDLATGQPVT